MASLFSDLGIDPYDGVLIAFLPKLDSVMQEFYLELGGDRLVTAYAQDGMVVDCIDTGQRDVRWWRVRDAARQLHMNIVEPIWSGPAADVTLVMLECLVEQYRPNENEKLHIRCFSRGPWISFSKKEKGKIAHED